MLKLSEENITVSTIWNIFFKILNVHSSRKIPRNILPEEPEIKEINNNKNKFFLKTKIYQPERKFQNKEKKLGKKKGKA